MPIDIAGDETLAIKFESFVNRIVCKLLQVLQLHLSIKDSIRLAAMCSQVVLEEL
jgi:hypothetical protein